MKDKREAGELSLSGCAYDPIYLKKAEATLAGMLDFAVYSLHISAEEFFALFIASGVAKLFQEGDIRTIAGRSGVELSCCVMDKCGLPFTRVRPRFTNQRSKELMCGEVLAYCQWKTSLSFADITEVVSVAEIIEMCEKRQKKIRQQIALEWPPADLKQDPAETESRRRADIKAVFDQITDKIDRIPARDTHLRTMRLRCGLSQSRLAAASGVPLRTIQQYEQRQKDINRAHFMSIAKLAAALGCEPSFLLER